MSERLTLRIEKPIYGGAGLARHEGKAVFTPFTLPGELVTATVTKSKDSFAEAALDTVLERAETRITPLCPYFGACGGCHYQHAAYEAQLAIKAAILEETLTRAHLVNLPQIITHAGEPFQYRNRIRLHIDPITSALGYRERGSHRLLAVNQCPIAAPELERALEQLAPACVSRACGKLFSQLELSANHDGSQLLLGLWLRSPDTPHQAHAELTSLCELIKPLLPALRGGGVHGAPTVPVADRGRHSGKHRQREEADTTLLEDVQGSLIASWGEPRMTYRVRDLEYRVSLGAFFQGNRALVSELVELATQGRAGTLAWDLYAGVGLFSRVLARHFKRVIAVEGAPVSCEDLRNNLGRGGAHQAVRSGTLEFLRQQAAQSHARGRSQERRSASDTQHLPDFVLVDPPRAGLGAEVTALLSQLRPAQVTYVSCDPATLSRDLRALVESDYQLQQLHLIDLFPQTFHLETVAMLSLA